MTRFAWLVISFVLLTLPAKAQDLTETLSQVGEAYAESYVTPLAEALGANLNTGLFHTAGASKRVFGIDVYFGVKASASLLDASHKSFDLTYQSTVPLDVDFGGQTIRMNVPATFTVTKAPTIFGDEEEAMATVTVAHDTTISTLGLTIPVSFDSTLTPQETIGGLVELPAAPFAVPQIGLGTLFGTDIMFRWVPQITVDDVGGIGLFGFGIRHNINQYLPLLPVDISIQAAWQRLNIEDANGDEVMDANTFAVNFAASKKIGVLTVYAGLQNERSDVSFSYVFQPSDFDVDASDVDINFTVSNTSQTRGIFGFGLKLGPVVWNGDVSVGKFTVVSAGFGFAF